MNQPAERHQKMGRSTVRAVVALWGVLLLLPLSAAAGSGGPLLQAAESDSGGALVLYRAGEDRAEVLVHRGERPVSDLRLEVHESAGVLAARWRERGVSGDRVSVSLDDGSSWSQPRSLAHDLALRAGRFVPGEDSAPAVAQGLAARQGNRLYLVQFDLMSLRPLRRSLEELGAEVLSSVPHHAHVVRMDPAVAERVRGLGFVRWVGPHHPAWRLDPLLLDAGPVSGEEAPARRVVLSTYQSGPGEKALLAAEIARVGGQVVKQTPNGYLLEAMLDRGQLLEIAHSNHLRWMDPWGPPEDDMDIIRGISGANFVENMSGYDGTGVSGEVLDSGIDADHWDFDGVQFHGGYDASSHGTSTYGIVFGNGDRDGDGEARATGHMPAGTGWFADYGFLGDRYQHTAELVQDPINAVFQTNSWGDPRTRDYTNVSAAMDDMIWLNDIVIFQSQSNAGNQDSRPQAWAKNIVSVGAVNHYDTATLADDCWCGGASIGPAADGRIKPDLSYFYDDIYTTAPDGYTASFGGTSGATPIVAGLGGLMFQMWADNILGNNPLGASVFEKRPHAATAKAILINTANQYPFSGANHDLTRTHQGWGLPNVENFLTWAPLMKVFDEEQPMTELQVHDYEATVAAGQGAIKITMVYTDRAGDPVASVHRVNALSLRVLSPSATEYWGNNGLDTEVWSAPGGSRDNLNNVQNVFIPNPEPGTWTIEIHADEINQDQTSETPEVDQDYGLVTYGFTSVLGCRDRVNVPSNLTATPNGDNTIELSWTGSASGYKILRSDSGCDGPFELLDTVGPLNSYSDTTVSGGLTYSYRVRAVEECDSYDSVCSEATATGPCLFEPSFDGVGLVGGAGSSTCTIRLSWEPAETTCGGPMRYNVYRSTDPDFTPSAVNRVAECLATTTHLDQFALVSGQLYYYVVRAEDLAAAPATGVCGGLEEANLTKLAADPMTLHRADFETGTEGWSDAPGQPAASTGFFIAGDPVGTFDGTDPAQPEDDHTPDPGVQCFYTGANPTASLGSADVDDGEVVALSPLLDADGFTDLRVTLWRWHFIRDLGEDDYYAMDVSNDGGQSWTNLETLDSNTSAAVWTEVSFDLQDFVPLTDSMQIRIRSADGTDGGNIVETAIDDVLIAPAGDCSPAGGGELGATHPLYGVKRLGSMARFTWAGDCGLGTRSGVYEGDLDLGYSSLAAMPGQCDLVDTSMDVPLDDRDNFYMVAPNDGAEEGSLGLLRPGVQRPQPAAVCHPRAAALHVCAM